MSMAACLGCGKPIPELIMVEGKFNFVCTKCHCETKPQDTLEEAERLWNEGRIYPQNNDEFMDKFFAKIEKNKDDCKEKTLNSDCGTSFAQVWDNEVKKLAQACVTEPKLVTLMQKGDDYKPNQEEEAYLKEISEKGYKDIYGMYYISDMIWRIEHALADGRESLARLAAADVYAVLNGSTYFVNVFNSDESNEEWKTRKALRDGLDKLIKL